MQVSHLAVAALTSVCATAPADEPVTVHVRFVASPKTLTHPSNRTGLTLRLDRRSLEQRLRKRLAKRRDLILVPAEQAEYELTLLVDELFGPEFIGTSDLFPGTQDFWVRVRLNSLLVQRRGALGRPISDVAWLEANEKVIYESHAAPIPRREERLFELALERAADRVFDQLAARHRPHHGTP